MTERDKASTESSEVPKPQVRVKLVVLLLALPYLALCFPGLYARATPALFGFPFFYWYQFLWVIVTAASLGIVYRMVRTPEA